MTVKGDSFAEGTNHYECGEVCDIASDHIPDPEKMVGDVTVTLPDPNSYLGKKIRYKVTKHDSKEFDRIMKEFENAQFKKKN